MPQLCVHDPEMIKDILVRDWTSFADRTGGIKSGNPVTDNFLTNLVGNDWKRMRSVMSPTFTSGKMKFMFTAMNDCCHLMTENIRKETCFDRKVLNFTLLSLASGISAETNASVSSRSNILSSDWAVLPLSIAFEISWLVVVSLDRCWWVFDWTWSRILVQIVLFS